MTKSCPACSEVFLCNANDIQSCGCAAIQLSAATQARIAKKYKDCLCPNCLKKHQKIMTQLEEKIEQSKTRVFKAVFPNTTNHYDTLFGGTALQMMDEVAFICATRFCRKKVVTVSSDRVDFKHPIPAGTLIELVAEVTEVGRTSMKVRVDIFVEEMYQENREKAITGVFTFVAVNELKRPVAILPKSMQV